MDVNTILSIVGAIAAVAGTRLFGGAVRQESVDRTTVREVVASKPELIESMSLDELGDYLFDTIGAMPVHAYANDRAARQTVARAVDRLGEIVTPAAEGSQASRGHLGAAEQALLASDAWTALARMRLAVEIRLREIALQAGVEPRRMAANALLRVLAPRTIPGDVARRLTSAVSIANRAVHGETVSLDAARAAVDDATVALRELDEIDARPT